MSAYMHSTIPQLRLTVKISTFVIILFFQFFFFVAPYIAGSRKHEHINLLISQKYWTCKMWHASKHKFVKPVPRIFFSFSFFFFCNPKKLTCTLNWVERWGMFVRVFKWRSFVVGKDIAADYECCWSKEWWKNLWAPFRELARSINERKSIRTVINTEKVTRIKYTLEDRA